MIYNYILSFFLLLILFIYIHLTYNIDNFKKSKILVIENKVYSAHLEILESLIVKNNEIIKKNIDFDHIYLFIYTNDKSFINYITDKYSNVSVVNNLDNINYDYHINATIYPYKNGKFKILNNGYGDPRYLNLDTLNKPNHFYISHRISETFNPYSNVMYLTPLSNISNKHIIADKLPFTEQKKKADFPIFIVVGRSSLRNNKLLENTLLSLENYDKKFQVKYLSRNNPKLNITKNVKICQNYNFVDFHKEILDAHCMITLISEKEQPNYYKNQLTSSINYIYAYKFKALTDKKLKHIYNLNSNDCYIYNPEDQQTFIQQFKKVIDDFYTN